MFIPLWVSEFFSVTPFISFKEQVLQNAKDIYSNYKSDCGSKKLLGVHFRRGDYLAASSLNLDLNYYVRALSFFAPSEWSLLIFSDDIDFCKSLHLFASWSVSYSAERSDVLDMALMSLCDGLVIANSSFSFWGGLLGGRHRRPVVCPSQFFGVADPFHSQINGLWFPEGWVSLEVGNARS